MRYFLVNPIFKIKSVNCLFCALVFFTFFSCKQKKEVVNLPKSSQQHDSQNLKEVEFGVKYVTACNERAKGNLQEALKLFEQCSTLIPGNAPARYEMATIYKLLGQNELALSNARFCADNDPKNEWYQLLLIDCYNALKQYNQSVKIRESLVKKFPEKSEFKEDLAIEYAVMGQYDKSYRIYHELEQMYGINEQITLNKVKLLKSQKKYKETETELKRLSASNKNEPRYYAYLAEYYLEMNEIEKAKEMYDKILAVDPNNANVHLALHDYHKNKGDDKEAFSHLKKAMENKDLDVGTKASIVGSYYKKAEEKDSKAQDQGEQLAKLMLEAHPSATESNALYADFLRLARKNREAAVYYYKAAVNEKRDYRVWDNLLFIDNELGRYDSLERHSRIAIDLFPNQPLNYLYNGVANTQLKNYRASVQALTDGMEFVIDNNNMMVQFLAALGDAHFYLKEYPQVDQRFDEALKINADNTYVLNNYAYYLSVRNENLERAEKLSKKSNELQPGNKNYMDTYGWILYQQKKFKEAEIWLEKAARGGSKSPTILEHYGDVLNKLDKKQEALIQWEAALQAGGNSAELREKIKELKPNE